MSMSRDYSNVFLKSYKISVKALGYYEKDLAHVLTKPALAKLLEGRFLALFFLFYILLRTTRLDDGSPFKSLQALSLIEFQAC